MQELYPHLLKPLLTPLPSPLIWIWKLAVLVEPEIVRDARKLAIMPAILAPELHELPALKKASHLPGATSLWYGGLAYSTLCIYIYNVYIYNIYIYIYIKTLLICISLYDSLCLLNLSWGSQLSPELVKYFGILPRKARWVGP